MEASLIQQCRLVGLPEPVTQYRFAPPRRWRYDLAWPDRRLVVDCEGGLYLRGGGWHQNGTEYENDLEKHNQASILGYRVLRFGPKAIASGEAIATIQRALEADR